MKAKKILTADCTDGTDKFNSYPRYPRHPRFNFFLLCVLFVSAFNGFAQATQPSKFPVGVWFQPARNVPLMASLGVNTFFGPEVENSGAMKAADLAAARMAWCKAVADVGGSVVLKNPVAPLPANCVGFLLSVDEPNGKGVLPAALAAEVASLRVLDKSKPIFLSLAGDKVTSANFARPAEAQLYRDYAALADVLTVDWYSINRNANRYPTTLTGDAVAKLAGVTDKPIWAICECSDQKLLPPPPLPAVARGPSGDEIGATANYAVSKGAKGIVWFATSSRGAYGWPQSYWPCSDEQSLAVKAVGLVFNPTLDSRVAALERRVKKLEGK